MALRAMLCSFFWGLSRTGGEKPANDAPDPAALARLAQPQTPARPGTPLVMPNPVMPTPGLPPLGLPPLPEALSEQTDEYPDLQSSGDEGGFQQGVFAADALPAEPSGKDALQDPWASPGAGLLSPTARSK